MNTSFPSIITVSGRSGVGKDVLVKNFFAQYPSAQRIESVTTRPPRVGEKNSGYIHVSEEEFEARKHRDEFIWDIKGDGNRYGTNKITIQEALGGNGLFLTILVPDKVRELRTYACSLGKEHLIRSLYLHTSDIETLRQRTTQRGDSQTSIATRLEEEQMLDSDSRFAGVRYLYINALSTPDECLQRAMLYIFGDRRSYFFRRRFPRQLS